MKLNDMIRYFIAALLSLMLAIHGKKKKSLSNSGAIAAILVGFTSFAVSYKLGVILILFYYVSSKFTKLKEDIKSRLEDGYLQGGQRSAIQVFSCSLLATIVAVFLMLYCNHDMNISFIPSGKVIIIYDTIIIDEQLLGSWLNCMYIAHYATAAGDTWASELGILSTSHPRLITSLFMKKVPPGTNGGMSLYGTIASAAGGAFIGFIYYLYDVLLLPPSQNKHMIIIFGTLCGVIGSLVDSLLGATLQVTYYSKSKKRIMKNVNKDDGVVVICGVDILSNEAVNFLSILITMIISIWIAPIMFDQ